MKKGKKIWNRLLNLVLCLVMVTGMFAGMGMEAEATATIESNVTIVEHSFTGWITEGLKVEVHHDAQQQKVTVKIDAENFRKSKGEECYWASFAAEVGAKGVGGDPVWSDPEETEGRGATAQLTYSYNNSEELYGVYRIQFNPLSLSMRRSDGTGYTDEGYQSLTLLFPMTESKKGDLSFSAQMRKVLDDGSPTESGY